MVKMWEGAIIMLVFLALIPAALANLSPASNTVECPTNSLTYWALNFESSGYNYTTFIVNSVPGVWTDPTTIELNETYDLNWGTCPSNSCKSFQTKFNWSEIPLGIYSNPDVCLEHCAGMSCVDECSHLKIINPPRVNVDVSASDVSTLTETNFTIVLENPTAGNITANTTAKIMLNGNEVRTFDLGSTDMAPHSTQTLVQTWTPDKAGPYKVDANIIFYSADYNNSEQFSNTSEIDVNEGTPTTSQIINIEDLPDTSSKDFTITVTNPTGFNFTTNLTAKAIYNSNTNWSDTQSVQLDPLSEKNVTFTWKPAFMADYDIKADTEYNTTTKPITVGAPGTELTIAADDLQQVQQTDFNVTVKNPTGFQFSTTLDARATWNSKTNWTDSKDVSLEPFDEKIVTFTWTPDNTGKFDIKANDDYNSTTKSINVGKPEANISFDSEFTMIHEGLEGYKFNVYVKNPTGFEYDASVDLKLYYENADGTKKVVYENNFGSWHMQPFNSRSATAIASYDTYQDLTTGGDWCSGGALVKDSSEASGEKCIIMFGDAAGYQDWLNSKGTLYAELDAYGKTVTKEIMKAPSDVGLKIKGAGLYDPNSNVLIGNSQIHQASGDLQIKPSPTITLPKQDAQPSADKLIPNTGNVQVNAGNLQLVNTQPAIVVNKTAVAQPNTLLMQHSFASR